MRRRGPPFDFNLQICNKQCHGTHNSINNYAPMVIGRVLDNFVVMCLCFFGSILQWAL